MSAFSKQHYVAIADDINDAYSDADDQFNKGHITHAQYEAACNAIDRVTRNLCKTFARDNANFKRGLFISACYK